MISSNIFLFLSTLSLRRATGASAHAHLPIFDFYPRSPCGERPGVKSHDPGKILISIHALLAESDLRVAVPQHIIVISIHALLAESDLIFAARHPTARVFLSTLSLRRATHKSLHRGRFLPFLSTLSLRRATANIYETINRNRISIHALLAESDTIFAVRPYDAPIFLSTLSLRRATTGNASGIHTHWISIHALLAESDPQIKMMGAPVDNFYPRSPCGERRTEPLSMCTRRRFLSTLSLRRATPAPTPIL